MLPLAVWRRSGTGKSHRAKKKPLPPYGASGLLVFRPGSQPMIAFSVFDGRITAAVFAASPW